MTDVTTEFFVEKGRANELLDELKLGKECADLLNNHYPGHLWGVSVNTDGGILIIKNFAISSLYGYVIHLKNVLDDPHRKRVIMAGGEYLERAAMTHRFTGEMPAYVEGLPDKHQPLKNGLII